MWLKAVWHVQADQRYRHWPKRMAESPLVLVRTLEGLGALDVVDAGPFTLAPGTVFITEIKRIRYYGTAHSRWHFRWYEFGREGGIGLPWDERLMTPLEAWETATAPRILALLALPDAASQMAASALFNAQLHDWAAGWQRHDCGSSSGHAIVHQAIKAMQSDLSRPVSIAALARAHGVSERWLRATFSALLGMSPKQYYTHLRLTQAAYALRMGQGNITAVAERFGYASPFHFSRAFKAKYGCSPRVYLSSS
jgi:AraC-like DNA-binding protein